MIQDVSENTKNDGVDNDKKNGVTSAEKTIIDEKKHETTKLGAEVVISDSENGSIPQIKHEVSQTVTKQRADGSIKRETFEKSVERFDLQHRATETEQTAFDYKYDRNGQLESSTITHSKDSKNEPSAINIANGHTDSNEFGYTEKNSVRYTSTGEQKDKQTSSENYGHDWHHRNNTYIKGKDENPERYAAADVSERAGNKRLRIDAKNGQTYSADISNTSESYTYGTEQKQYGITRDAEGKLNVKLIMKKDAQAAQKLIEGRAAEYQLAKARRMADSAVREATAGEYDNAQQYLNSVHAERKNIGMPGDYFNGVEKKVENFQQIKTETEKKARQEFEDKAKITAAALLQQKINSL